MKNHLFLLTAILFAAFTMNSCSPAEKMAKKEERQEKLDKAFNDVGKNAFREILAEKEANRKKYNVECNYAKRPGEIVITKVEKQKDNKVRVVYDFKPATAGPKDEQFKLGSKNRVVFFNGGYPTQEWCDRNGVETGARFPATRLEIIDGYKTEYCSSFEFEIPLLKTIR